MAKILYKKSYQLSSFKPIKYDDLWGKKGVFSTIRVIGKTHKLILLNKHVQNINSSLNKININFKISEKLILKLFKLSLNKIKHKDTLLRIAINSNKISLSIRPRLKTNKKIIGKLFSYQRSIPSLKNLYYKKIIKLLNSINSKKQEIILYNKGILLEGCTTNIICIRNKKIYIPIKNYYKGITVSYLLNLTKREIKKTNIFVNDIYKYEEILLIGSGKGVVSVSSIPQINWKSQSDLVYKEFKYLYEKLL